ncbi:MarC family NAAT transporter [Opitutus sp. GAS368]|uniref:MarC family NAAT transporter n=1 Tax=Opitutus sp. GAS368 TaxID=1882749 RepID=UPI00087BA0A8|nr:MarC family NAAT transporter [Opitutus sp. GAS368]SDS03832.1 multiple antibiotic resistance protein [Opitutus sp. GAS368]
MSNVTHLWAIFLGTFIGLLPIINPLAAAPTFLAITEGDSVARRREQARKGCLYMVAILVSFLIGGTFIMNFFGISIPGLRIAGGILMAGIGMDMLLARNAAAKSEDEEERAAAVKKADISFSPLAMPMLSGPGSIAVTLGFTSLADGWFDYLAIIAGIITVALITYVVLRLSSRIVGFIGPVGVNAMTKIMGFLIMCIGVQFVVNGVLGIATEPALLRAIKAALAAH